jgi:hypothetical protein
VIDGAQPIAKRQADSPAQRVRAPRREFADAAVQARTRRTFGQFDVEP